MRIRYDSATSYVVPSPAWCENCECVTCQLALALHYDPEWGETYPEGWTEHWERVLRRIRGGWTVTINFCCWWQLGRFRPASPQLNLELVPRK